MNKKLIILVLILIANFLTIRTTKAQTTTVYVDPQITMRNIGETLEINISIIQVADLAAWEFKLYYESFVLNATSITEGPFLRSVGNTQWIEFNFTDSYNATHGRIWIACMLLGSGPGASGNGTLATIAFKAKGAGITDLHLTDTDLLDSEMPPNRIPHTTLTGTVKIGGHDIAVTSVTSSKTIVGLGFRMNINVTVENLGDLPETFNVTVYANTTEIETKEVTLTNGSSTTLTFIWNTTGFVKGNYTIWAYAEPVPGETDIGDNRYIDGWVVVTIPGDFSGDFNVGPYDFALLSKAYGSMPSKPGMIGPWNPNCDVNDDNKVGPFDFTVLSIFFGKQDP